MHRLRHAGHDSRPLVVDGITVVPDETERTATRKACVVFERTRGTISRATEYFDASAMAQQLGIDQKLL